MSKKKIKKIKNKVISTASVESSLNTNDIVQSGNTSIKSEIIEEKTLSQDEIDAEKYAYVKKDIKKVLALMSIVVVLLIGSYFLGSKTSVLGTFGDWLYKALNIQTG